MMIRLKSTKKFSTVYIKLALQNQLLQITFWKYNNSKNDMKFLWSIFSMIEWNSYRLIILVVYSFTHYFTVLHRLCLC